MATSALPLGTDVSTNDRFARQKLPLTTQNAISALPRTPDIVNTGWHVSKVPILLQKSKIEQAKKSRQS
jgi:hypothetical protein